MPVLIIWNTQTGADHPTKKNLNVTVIPGKSKPTTNKDVTSEENANPFLRHFTQWCRNGGWECLLETLKIAPDIEVVMIAATVVRAYACAAGHEKDSQKEKVLGCCDGEFPTKFNILISALDSS